MMKKRFAWLLSLWLIFVYTTLHAQQEPAGTDSAVPAGFRTLQYNTAIPESLLRTKSVVFVSTSPNAKPDEWKALAAEAHTSFRKAGVDAVAYYYLGDVKAGRDASRQLIAEMQKREIQNIIVLSQHKREAALLILPFDDETNFVSGKQPAYKLESPGMDQLLIEFQKAVFRSGLEVENHLINDRAEFFVGAGKVFKGKRFEAFAQDLKLDKLAVPSFADGNMPQVRLASNEAVSADQIMAQSNEQLKAVMEAFPYEYELVDPQLAEDKIRQSGYQYLLLRLHTTPAHIKDMLGYQAKPGESSTSSQTPGVSTPGVSTLGVSTLGVSTLGVSTPVYKYYVKHIYTGDVYLGTTWDADEDWQTALANYIRQMKKELNIGK